MLCFIALLVAVQVVSSSELTWTLYKKQFGKSYLDLEERLKRDVFETNTAVIAAHNVLKNLGVVSNSMHLSPTTDVTRREFELRGARIDRKTINWERSNKPERFGSTLTEFNEMMWELFVKPATWALYKAIHKKKYTKEEEPGRKAVFEKNIEIINDYNFRTQISPIGPKTVLGLTSFTDVTNDDFKRFVGSKVNASLGARTKPTRCAAGIQLPRQFDWMPNSTILDLVAPVKHQGHCASGWIYSAVASLEGQDRKTYGSSVTLSEQYLVNSFGKAGKDACTGGSMEEALDHIKTSGGIVGEDQEPGTGGPGGRPSEISIVKAHVNGYEYVQQGDARALKEAVFTIGPISVGMHGTSFIFQNYKNGIIRGPDCSSETLDHAALVVGYGEVHYEMKLINFWLIKNSFGESWGESGFARVMIDENNVCGVTSAALYPVL